MLQAQKVLQQLLLANSRERVITWIHVQQQQHLQGVRMSVTGSIRFDLQLTSIGIALSKSSLNPTSKEVLIQSKPFEELCMLRRDIPKMNNDTFQQIIRKTTSFVSFRRRAAGTTFTCVKQQHGCSMEPIGSVY